MNKFDEFAEKAGWIKPYGDTPLWYKEHQGRCLCKFSIQGMYQMFDNRPDLIVDEESVNSFMTGFVTTTCESKNKGWVLPMLASDYWNWDNDKFPIEEKNKEIEIKYAKIAMEADSKLKPESFSFYIREML